VEDLEANALVVEESAVALDLDDELPALSLLLPLLVVDFVLREASFSLLDVAEKLLTSYQNIENC